MLVISDQQMAAMRGIVRAAFPARLEEDWCKQDLDVRREPNGDLVGCNASGHEVRAQFNPDGSLASIQQPSGAAHGFEHDGEGRLKAINLPTGERNEYVRDTLGNMVCLILQPNNASYGFNYNDQGLLSALHYPDGGTARFAYDEKGRLLSWRLPGGGETRYHRHKDGRLARRIDPLGRSVSFAGDTQGRLSAVNYPDGRSERFACIPEKNLTELTRCDGQTVQQWLDEAGQVQTVRWHDESWLDLARDNKGRLTQLLRNNHQINWVYNDGGKVGEEKSTCINPDRRTKDETTIGYQYDIQGRLTTLQTADNVQIHYVYDGDGRLAQLTDWAGQVVQFHYGDDARLTHIQYPSGLVEQHEYSSDGLVIRWQQQEHTLSEQCYRYDGNGRLCGFNDRQFVYDADSRLIEERQLKPGPAIAPTVETQAHYGYDAAGNLVNDNGTAVKSGVCDEPRDYGGEAIIYDAQGQMIRLPGAQGPIQCHYSADGHLISLQSAGRTVHYQYDPAGRRISSNDGQTHWRYGWSGNQLLWESVQSTSNQALPHQMPLRRDYLYLPDSVTPFAFREAGCIYYVQSDQRGAVIAVVDEQGEVVWQAVYESFGQAQIQIEKIRQPWRLMGQCYDEESGLHYNRARYYSPLIKSYLSRDPQWHYPGGSFYSYALNDPWNKVDPYGTFAFLAALVVGLVATVAGAVVGGVVALATGGDPIQGAIDGALGTAGAIVGGVAGFAVGGPMGAFTGGVAGSSAGAAGGELVRQARAGDPLCASCALKVAGFSAAIEVATLGLARIPGVKSLVKQGAEKARGAASSAAQWTKKKLDDIIPAPMLAIADGGAGLNNTLDTSLPGTGGGAVSVVADTSPLERSFLGSSEGHQFAGSVTPGGTGTAYAGHGKYVFGSGDVTVPNGSAVTLPRDGIRILDDTGRYIEAGDWDGLARAASQNPRIANDIEGMTTWLPGAKVPNYTLSAPTNPPLNILQNSSTVQSGTTLDRLLQPNMGCVQWAACTEF